RWRDEEFRYEARASKALAAAPSGGQIPERPASFVTWAKADGLSSPASVRVSLITATGRAATRGTAKTVVRSATREAAKTEVGKGSTRAPTNQAANRRRGQSTDLLDRR